MPATLGTTTYRGRAAAGPYSLGEICALMRISRMTLMRWVRAGRFPRPLNVGMRRLFWARATVDRALAGRRG
jgi:predicted DNA-binding transcriptional regulator AlpA